jgi:hypothetical protein
LIYKKRMLSLFFLLWWYLLYLLLVVVANLFVDASWPISITIDALIFKSKSEPVRLYYMVLQHALFATFGEHALRSINSSSAQASYIP